MGYLKEKMNDDLLRYGLRPATRKQYLHCAESYVRHFKCSPKQLGTAEIESWIKYLARSEKRPVSLQYQALMALKFLYFVTLDRPHVAACFLSPGKPGSIPDPLSQLQLKQLLGSVISELHKTVLTVAFGGGLRIGEVCHLRAGDIDGKRMLIRLSSSNSTWPQFVPLHKETLGILRKWWCDKRPHTDMLFSLDQKGKILTPGPVQKAIRQAARDGDFDYVTIEKVMRYSFFIHRLYNTNNPRKVRHILRCTSIRPASSFIAQRKMAALDASASLKGGRI